MMINYEYIVVLDFTTFINEHEVNNYDSGNNIYTNEWFVQSMFREKIINRYRENQFFLFTRMFLRFGISNENNSKENKVITI